MERPRAAVSWSGGKDCCLALHRAWPNFDIVAAVTMFNEDESRSRSHGLRPDVIRAQADRLGLDVVAGRVDWPTYEIGFRGALVELATRGVTHVIFGDIFGDDHRAWTERVCALEGLTAIEPLWNEPTLALVRELLALGATARLTTVRADQLDETWLGRTLDLEMVAELDRLGLDVCGERGEYHTVVTDCPLFHAPLQLTEGERVLHRGCWALDFSVADARVEAVC